MYRKIIIFLIVVANVLVVSLAIFSNHDGITAEEALSKFGSQGNEVINIQTRLKRWGYYRGEVDGIFGSRTLEAVRYFQRRNGLNVDGIAGSRTLAAMGINSGGSSSRE